MISKSSAEKAEKLGKNRASIPVPLAVGEDEGDGEEEAAQVGGRHLPVPEAGEPGRGEQVDARDEEADHIQPDGVPGQGRQVRVIAHKEARRRAGGQFRHQRHQGAEYQQEDHRMPQEALQFHLVPRPVVVADDRRDRDVVPEEDRGEDVSVVEQDRVGG